MQQRHPPFVPSYSNLSAILHEWHTALGTAQASRKADLYACVVVLVMESLDRYTTIQDLIKAYCSPNIGLKSRVFALSGDGEIRLQPQVVLGPACAL
jgi:hypothetical protein